MHELRNAPLSLICFFALCSPPRWSGCGDLGVLSSLLILCESTLLEQSSRINPPFTLSKGKRASSVQTLSCNCAQLTEILLPGRISVTLAVWGEKVHVHSHLWHEQKEGFYDRDPVRDGCPGSALLQVMWTWRHPRLNRAWIIKKTEEKSAVVKVSRWGWNTLLKKIIFSARIPGIQWQSVRRDYNEGQVDERSSNQPTRVSSSYTGDNILTLCCTEQWLCCLPINKGGDVQHVLTIWCHVASFYKKNLTCRYIQENHC